MNSFYGLGTGRMFRRIASNFGLTFTFVNAQDSNNVAAAITQNTKVPSFIQSLVV